MTTSQPIDSILDILSIIMMSVTSRTCKSKLMKATLPKLTLYGDLNMRPFRNAWMMQELQLSFKHILCKPWSRVAKSVHPLGKVPSLLVEYPKILNEKESEEAPFFVFESAAINTFLGDLVREHDDFNKNEDNARPILVPAPGTKERARYESVVSFIMTELDAQSLWIHRKHEDLASVFGEAPTAVKEAKRQFRNSLKAMEDELHVNASGDCSYILPGGFSAADILFVDCCFWAKHIGWLVKNNGDKDGSITQALIFPGSNNDNDDNCSNWVTKPIVMTQKLEKYLTMCRSRNAFKQAIKLKKEQRTREHQSQSKL